MKRFLSRTGAIIIMSLLTMTELRATIGKNPGLILFSLPPLLIGWLIIGPTIFIIMSNYKKDKVALTTFLCMGIQFASYAIFLAALIKTPDFASYYPTVFTFIFFAYIFISFLSGYLLFKKHVPGPILMLLIILSALPSLPLMVVGNSLIP